MKRMMLALVAMLMAISLDAIAQGPQTPLTPEEQVRRDKAYARYCESLSQDPREVLQLADSQGAELLELIVNDSVRRAVVVYPKDNSKPAPLIFVYHGRGGLISKSIKNIDIYKYWPEAIVVYSQGLWRDGGNKIKWGAAWQMPTKKRASRDIKLFDAQMEYICSHYNVDISRVFAMGHSNGGGMTYGLWSRRGDKLAGVCISCCNSDPESWLSQQRQNKPVFFMLAEEDQLVEYEKYDSYIKHVVGKQSTGKSQPLVDGIEFYPASEDLGAPVITYYYPGRHRFEHDAMPYIVEFFKSL